MLRAEALSNEAARLREMVGELKKHDDELYAAQSGSAAEINQLRASLASAEERVASGRIALDAESTRRVEAERRLEVARSERATLLAKSDGKAEAESKLAALQASHVASLAQRAICWPSPPELVELCSELCCSFGFGCLDHGRDGC